MRAVLVSVIAGSILAIGLTGCSGGSPGAQSVHAQSTTYSNADFTGTYNFTTVGGNSQTTGSMSANGSGAITGSSTDNSQGGTCIATLSGTYSVISSGSGTMSITTTITGGTNPSCSGGSGTFQLAVANSGDLVVFSGLTGSGATMGLAVK